MELWIKELRIQRDCSSSSSILFSVAWSSSATSMYQCNQQTLKPLSNCGSGIFRKHVLFKTTDTHARCILATEGGNWTQLKSIWCGHIPHMRETRLPGEKWLAALIACSEENNAWVVRWVETGSSRGWSTRSTSVRHHIVKSCIMSLTSRFLRRH